MTARRARILWMVALCFFVLNLAATVFAAVQEEQIHTDVHVLFALVGAYFVWRLSPRRALRQ